MEHNDKIPLTPASLTRFHSRAPPGISVSEYLQRIAKYTNAEACCLLIVLYYVDRLSEKLPTFTISSLTVHRFVIAAVAASSKAISDSFCTNGRYAKVGGVSLAEMNVLEKELLSGLEYRLTVRLLSVCVKNSRQETERKYFDRPKAMFSQLITARSFKHIHGIVYHLLLYRWMLWTLRSQTLCLQNWPCRRPCLPTRSGRYLNRRRDCSSALCARPPSIALPSICLRFKFGLRVGAVKQEKICQRVGKSPLALFLLDVFLLSAFRSKIKI